MNWNQILNIVVITLVLYSVLSTLFYVALKENEEILAFFGMGIVGWIICLLVFIVTSIIKFIDGNKWTLVTKDDLLYKVRARHRRNVASKGEFKISLKQKDWLEIKSYPNVPKEYIKECSKNCMNCINSIKIGKCYNLWNNEETLCWVPKEISDTGYGYFDEERPYYVKYNLLNKIKYFYRYWIKGNKKKGRDYE